MKYIQSYLAIILFVFVSCTGTAGTKKTEASTMRQVLNGKILIGCAVNVNQTNGEDSVGSAIIAAQYNSITPENCMKSEVIHPEENRYDFIASDAYVDYGMNHGMFIIGHCLVWHSQLAPWFCVDKDGKNVSPEVLKQRLKTHIETIVGRYKGRIKGWDVVNEAFNDDGTYRQSKFYQILGEEFIPLAFQYAHEADPDAELYYNDYSMVGAQKRDSVISMVRKLKARGIRIDGIGMQMHSTMEDPNLSGVEKSIEAFASTGCKVMITEFDMSVLPNPFAGTNASVANRFAYTEKTDPFSKGLPDSVSTAWNKRMNDFFLLFLKHADVISRVTMWGLADSDSWRNDWPIRGRTDYPLLFDRSHQSKAIVDSIISEAKKVSVVKR
ncbi:MAG: endo-1,4-beta-xylanase [Bacteroidaceae bacterium]